MAYRNRSTANVTAPAGLEKAALWGLDSRRAYNSARLLEMLGIRRYYAAMAKMGNEAMLPSARGLMDTHLTLDWGPKRVERMKETARYFAMGNAWRIFGYTPLLAGLALARVPWAMAALSFMVCFSILSVMLELYKRALCDLYLDALHRQQQEVVEDTEEASPKTYRPQNWLDRWAERFFRPKWFETPRFYKWIGMDYFRSFVLHTSAIARLEPSRRAEGARVAYLERPSRKQVLEFESGTRTGEIVHWFALGLSIVIALALAWSDQTVAFGYAIFVAVFDSYCALLQRSHRVRVWKLVQRARGRA